MTEVVSLIVALRVEQRELRGRGVRAKSRPGTTMESPTAGMLARVVVKLIKQVEDQSTFLSTKTFSLGT
jgi:hypothetical protein